MVSMSGISNAGGYLIVFLLSNWFDWRSVSLFCAFIPIAALMLLTLVSTICLLGNVRQTLQYHKIFVSVKVPETPMWLLSRHRDKAASKSLQWLRGWVAEEEIHKELNELKRYREYSNTCDQCKSSKSQCTHSLPSLMNKIKGVCQTSYMKPMLIIALSSFFTHFTGAHHINPYLAQVLNTFQTPMQPSKATVITTLLHFGAIHFILVYFVMHVFHRFWSVLPHSSGWSSVWLWPNS